MPAPMFHYIDGAADDEWTLRRNTAAFDGVEFLPRALVDVSTIDMSTTLFGQKIEWPYFCSPTALQRLFHYEGEGGTARAAHASGTIFSLSSVSSTNIEDAAKLSPGPKVFQVYMFRDRGLSREFVQRARDSGYVALQLTVDVTVSGNRERDIVTGMTVPPKLALMSLIDIAMKPKWVYKHLTTPKIEVANIAHRPPPGSDKLGGIIQFLNAQIDRSITWKDAEWMIKQWGGPFAIKGVMTGEDAKRAHDIGASAVMVSNHGGRQLDFSPAPFDVLKEIVDAAGDRLEVILDGGVRRGTHILKALALGARACSAGRPHLYGLGAGGEAGVHQALKILKTELARDMALLGCPNVRAIDSSFVRRVGGSWAT
ncbi:MAG TPA: alpha-hydroxy acid oxidase [Gammaproteobacteria bacterium]|nr:alpha-hydroxy acid oxidase [Gammaproteobacteria bacterium]